MRKPWWYLKDGIYHVMAYDSKAERDKIVFVTANEIEKNNKVDQLKEKKCMAILKIAEVSTGDTIRTSKGKAEILSISQQRNRIKKPRKTIGLVLVTNKGVLIANPTDQIEVVGLKQKSLFQEA